MIKWHPIGLLQNRFFDWAPFIFSLVAGLVFGIIVSSVNIRSSLSLLNEYRPSTPTRLYDRNGQVFAELYRHRQGLVPFNKVPQHVVHAFLAVEDTGFYDHFGIDLPGIVRAMWINIAAGKIVQGGSTLTQQLAKQIYLAKEGKRSRSFTQKIRETILALQIEEELSKEEILETFFNVIYLGHGCKGLACAARLYFNKRVPELILAESALLARLPRSPTLYSPFKNPERVREVHVYVLNRMVEAGYLYANQVEKIHKDFWLEYWPKIIVRSPSQTTWSTRLDDAPYFTEYIRQTLVGSDEVGISTDDLYSKNLKIYTTLDKEHQAIAEREMGKRLLQISDFARSNALKKGIKGVDFSLFNLANSLRLLFPLPKPTVNKLDRKQKFRKLLEEDFLDGLQILSYLTPADNEAAAFDALYQQTATNFSHLQVEQAFVSIEPRTGYITSMIGGSKFSPHNQFNRVLQAHRQPGSAFKIFVYAAALEQRMIGTLTPINDAPFMHTADDGISWTPENYEPGFRGLVPVRRALASSLNTCAVNVYFKVGANPIIDLASRLMKIKNPEKRFNGKPAMALGVNEVTPMELTTAMAIIANEGRDVLPFAIRYITDANDNVIYNREEQIRKILAIKIKEQNIQVIEPGLAYIMKKLLRYVSDAGTARQGLRNADLGSFTGEFASKTGTTSNNSDVWITGFNPEYAATVWFGFDKSSITLGSMHSGGSAGAPTMGKIFRSFYKDKGASYPFFKVEAKRPSDVIDTSCGGLALAKREVDGKEQVFKQEGGCGLKRAYDEEDFIMKTLGIDPEEAEE